MIPIVGTYTSMSIKTFKHSARQFLLPYLKEKKAVSSISEMPPAIPDCI